MHHGVTRGLGGLHFTPVHCTGVKCNPHGVYAVRVTFCFEKSAKMGFLGDVGGGTKIFGGNPL